MTEIRKELQRFKEENSQRISKHKSACEDMKNNELEIYLYCIVLYDAIT